MGVTEQESELDQERIQVSPAKTRVTNPKQKLEHECILETSADFLMVITKSTSLMVTRKCLCHLSESNEAPALPC